MMYSEELDKGSESTEVERTSRLLLMAFAILAACGIAVAAVVALASGAEPIKAQFPAYGPGTVDPELCASNPDSCEVTLYSDPATGVPAYPREAYSRDEPVTFLYECAREPAPLVMSIIHGYRSDPLADPRTGQFDNIAEVAWTTDPNTLPIPDSRFGNCIAVPTVLNLPIAEMDFFSQTEGSTEHTIWFALEQAADQRAQVDFLVVDEVVERSVPLEQALEELRITPPLPERSIPLSRIWIPTLGLLGIVAAVGLAVARPVLAVARRAEVSAADAEQGRVDALRKRNQANRILSATHHELSREIAMVGFAVDDLTDEGVRTTDLLDTFSRLEAGRDTVAALAQLSAGNLHLARQTVVVADLVEPNPPVPVLPSGNGRLTGVDRLLLRTLVKRTVRLAAISSVAEVGIEIKDDTLRFELRSAPASAPTAFRRSWESNGLDETPVGELLAVMRSVADAHGAVAEIVDLSHAVGLNFEFSAVEDDGSTPTQDNLPLKPSTPKALT